MKIILKITHSHWVWIKYFDKFTRIGPAPPRPYKCIHLIMLIFCQIFAKNSSKFLKSFEKALKFSLKISKIENLCLNLELFIELVEIFWNLLERPGSSTPPPRTPYTSTPFISPPPGGNRLPIRKFHPGLTILYWVSSDFEMLKGISIAETRKSLNFWKIDSFQRLILFNILNYAPPGALSLMDCNEVFPWEIRQCI